MSPATTASWARTTAPRIGVKRAVISMGAAWNRRSSSLPTMGTSSSRFSTVMGSAASGSTSFQL